MLKYTLYIAVLTLSSVKFAENMNMVREISKKVPPCCSEEEDKDGKIKGPWITKEVVNLIK